MTATRAMVLVFAVVCGLLLAPVVSATFAGPVADIDGGASDETETDEGIDDDAAPMGAEVSSFMQSSSSSADESVDSKLFASAYDNAADDDDRADVVADRTDQLERRLAELEDERETLREERDELNPVAYDARMTRLAVQITEIERAINDTETRAASADLETDRFDELRGNAANIADREVASATRGLAGVDPPAGPPEDGAPGHDGQQQPATGVDASTGGSGGVSDDTSNESQSQSQPNDRDDDA